MTLGFLLAMALGVLGISLPPMIPHHQCIFPHFYSVSHALGGNRSHA